MKSCPKCHNTYDEQNEFCPLDGQRLAATPSDSAKQDKTILSGKYRITGELGSGGMGSVYLAEQIDLGNRPVAIKVLQPHISANPDLLERFKNEALTVGRLSHPNIVTIYEMSKSADGKLYIAMEYVPGVSLSRLLEKEGPLPPRRALRIAGQIARALDAAHQHGIIHRDIKPDNIMVVGAERGEDRVKLLDFGIAKLREDSSARTQTGVILGTPRYMSFEQAGGMSGSQMDSRSDIYSLGVVLYEMLTGGTPFDADTPIGTILKHVKEEPPPLSRFRPDLALPAELDALVLKCLSKDRNLRHSSAGELAQDLERTEALIGLQAEPKRPSAAAENYEETIFLSQPPPTRHHPVKSFGISAKGNSSGRWIGLGVAAAFLVFTGGFYLYLNTHSSDPAPRPPTTSSFNSAVTPGPGTKPLSSLQSPGLGKKEVDSRAPMDTPLIPPATAKKGEPRRPIKLEASSTTLSATLSVRESPSSLEKTGSHIEPQAETAKGALFRMEGREQEKFLIKQVEPVYPELAKRARVEGVVIIRLLIDETGHVAETEVMQGNPLLDTAAVEAVRQWVYKPMLVNGEQVRVATTVKVIFNLK